MNINKAIQLAVQSYRSGNLQQAEHFCQRVIKQQPNNAEALSFLGIIYVQLKNHDLAIHYLKKSLQLNPDNADAYLALGITMQQNGSADDAIGYYQKTISINPENDEAYKNLGNILREKGQLDDSIACFHKSIELNPSSLHAHYGLSSALVSKWKLDEAIKVCKRILQLNTADVFAYYTLGNILMTQGKLNEAELCFKHAMQINPDELKTHQAFLMLTSYYPKYNAQTIFSEHLHFAKQFEEPLRSATLSYANERISNRRLKIGYVSPDFKSHSVAYFIEPVLISHNRDLFEISCYSDVSSPDDVTNRIKKYTDHWLNIIGIPDENVAELIRKARIDILVDLAGHTGGTNRILLFARKPAPVQVSWIGYPGTTGLSAMDYKIVDSYTDPPGITEQYYSEELIRLPGTFLCYLPERDAPKVGTLPVFTSGHITFGSFNNFVKVVPGVITLWAKILKEVPGSRLIMKSLSFYDKATCLYALGLFVNEGIEAERISLLQPVPSIKDHLNLYNEIDIGLDTFPYNGTTTTCEALWMGVPVVTFAGDTPASRVGVSILSNVGIKELIGATYKEYVEIAVNLANDKEKLHLLREKLRDMMISSPLTNAQQYTRNLEECYLKIWETWAKSPNI